MVLALTLAAAIGLALALLGSGGSIVTLPVLVYAAGIPVGPAVGMSLAIVGATSLTASVFNARSGQVHRTAAVIFSLTGVVGAVGGAQLTHLVPSGVLMLSFGVLMALVAGLMLRQHKDPEPDPARQCRWPRCAATGAAVGILTGFLGVGGGFLIVPAMVFFGRLPLKTAIATSLVVISVNSFAGLAGQLRHTSFDWSITALFAGVAVGGMFLGRLFSERITTTHLRRAFAWFVLAVGAFVIARSWATFS